MIETIEEFNGAGKYAIAILNTDPALEEFEDRNGNIYIRWNGQHIVETMDKYWPEVLALKEMEDGD